MKWKNLPRPLALLLGFTLWLTIVIQQHRENTLNLEERLAMLESLAQGYTEHQREFAFFYGKHSGWASEEELAQAMPELLRLLDAESADVREMAAWSFAHLGWVRRLEDEAMAQAITSLVAQSADGVSDVRLQALHAIGQICTKNRCDPSAIRTLDEAWRDPGRTERERRAAQRWLGHYGDLPE